MAGRVPARPGRRLAAFLIDGACASVVVLIATVVLYGRLNSVLVTGSGAVTGAATAAILGPMVVWVLAGLLMVTVEGATGATIGNAAVRIRTVSVTTGKPAGFGRALGRRFIEQLGSLVIFGAPVIAASSTWDPTQLRQGWQDKAVGTTMVDIRPLPATSGVSAASLSAGGATASSSPSAPGWQQHRVVAPPPPPLLQPPPPLQSPLRPPAPLPALTELPVASPNLAGWLAPEVVIASGPPEPQARQAGVLIANVPGFAPEVASALPVTSPTPAPVAGQDLDEELDHTRMSPPRAQRTGSYQLVFDTGEIVIVDGLGLVGRNPEPKANERVEHLIPILDPDRSVSKTHLVFGAGPDGFWVSDRNSTNGTRAVSATGEITEAAHDVKVNVPMGGAVEFGHRRFTVAQL